MKHLKILAVVAIFFGSLAAHAQVKFGLRAGLNYNSNGDLRSISTLATNVIEGSEAKVGYQVGLWSEIHIKGLGLFVQPEVNYMRTKSEYDTTEYSLSKLDVPLLVGIKAFKILKIYAGPSFQFNLDSDFNLDDVNDVKTDDFNVGLNIGAGLQFKKIGFDVRYDRGLTENESNIFTNNISENFNIDARQKQVSFALTYKF